MACIARSRVAVATRSSGLVTALGSEATKLVETASSTSPARWVLFVLHRPVAEAQADVGDHGGQTAGHTGADMRQERFGGQTLLSQREKNRDETCPRCPR